MVVVLVLEEVPVSTGSWELVGLLFFIVHSGSVTYSFVSSPLSCYLICHVRHLKPIFVIYFLSFIYILLSCELETAVMLIQHLSV